MSYRPIEIVDSWEDWGVQDNPPRFRRGGRAPGAWSNFEGLEVKVAMIRAPNYDPSVRVVITGSEQAYRFMLPTLRDDLSEAFYVMILSAKHQVMGINLVSRGSQTMVEVHPANVLRPVLAAGGVAFIAFHNHPSEDPEPSPDDLLLTKRLVKAGELLGLPILDHIIVAPGRYVSLADRGQLG